MSCVFDTRRRCIPNPNANSNSNPHCVTLSCATSHPIPGGVPKDAAASGSAGEHVDAIHAHGDRTPNNPRYTPLLLPLQLWLPWPVPLPLPLPLSVPLPLPLNLPLTVTLTLTIIVTLTLTTLTTLTATQVPLRLPSGLVIGVIGFLNKQDTLEDTRQA